MIGAKTTMADATPDPSNKGALERWLYLIRGAEEGLIFETLTPES